MPKIILGTLTMNAGLGTTNSSVLLDQLHAYADIFNEIYICEGDYGEHAKKLYSSLPKNVHILDMPWDDNFVKRYETIASKADYGDWVLHLDDDELLSSSLFSNLSWLTFSEVDHLWLPCVTYMLYEDGKYYACEPEPANEYEGQWTKSILYRKTKGLSFHYFGSHVIPRSLQGGKYVPHPYLHLKTFESFIMSDIFQAFIHPEGQQYDAVEARTFKLLTKKYNNVKEFMKSTYEGTWPTSLKKFALDKQNMIDRPISRLAFGYFYVCGHGKEYVNYSWEEMQEIIIGKEKMNIFKESIMKGKAL